MNIINEKIENYTTNKFIDKYQYIRWYYSRKNLDNLSIQQQRNAKYCHKHIDSLTKSFNQYYIKNKNNNFNEKSNSANYLNKLKKSSYRGRTMSFIVWLLNGYIDKHLTNLQIAFICKCTVRFVNYVIALLRSKEIFKKVRDKHSNFYTIVRLVKWTKRWVFEFIDDLLNIYQHLNYKHKKQYDAFIESDYFNFLNDDNLDKKKNKKKTDPKEFAFLND